MLQYIWSFDANCYPAAKQQLDQCKIPSDGAPISPNQPSFGIPGQTKVSGDSQKETTHEICCLAAEWLKERRPNSS